MSTAIRKTQYATIGTYTVATGQTATVGYLAILASDTTVQNAAGATDLGIGVFLASATAGKRVEVYHFGSIIPVKIGTGGCTRGAKAVFVADGFTDAPAHDSSGTTDDATYGVFMESGVVGDVRGMMIGLNGNRGSA